MRTFALLADALDVVCDVVCDVDGFCFVDGFFVDGFFPAVIVVFVPVVAFVVFGVLVAGLVAFLETLGMDAFGAVLDLAAFGDASGVMNVATADAATLRGAVAHL